MLSTLKLHIGFRFPYLYLVMTYSICQYQDHAHFDWNSKLVTDWRTLLLPSNMKLRMSFRLAYVDLSLAHSKGQVHVANITTTKICKMMTAMPTIDMKYEVAYKY